MAMQTSNPPIAVPQVGLVPTVKPDPVSEFAANLGISKSLAELLSATRTIFSGPVWMEVDEDSELPDCFYIVFHVADAGSALENSSRRKEWYRVSRELLLEHDDKLRLTID